MNWTQYMANPKSFVIKKYMAEILNARFPPHEATIDRISTCLITDKDMEEFNKLVADIYETAYLKAVGDYREQLAKLGLKVSVVPEKPKT